MSDPKTPEEELADLGIEIEGAPVGADIFEIEDEASKPAVAAADPEAPAEVVAPEPLVIPPAPSPDVAELHETVRSLAEGVKKIDSRLTERDKLEEQASAAWQKTSVQGQIDKKRAELEEAHEKGNSKLAAQITTDIGELQAKKANLDRAPEREPVAAVTPEPAQRQAAPPIPAQTKGWMDRNRWFKHPNFQRETQAAVAIDRLLASKGYDPNTPEYFAEMDKRIHAEFSHLAPAAPKVAAAPVVQQTTTGLAQPVNRGKVRLTRDDLANMERFGMDPKDPKALREYAMNKVAA